MMWIPVLAVALSVLAFAGWTLWQLFRAVCDAAGLFRQKTDPIRVPRFRRSAMSDVTPVPAPAEPAFDSAVLTNGLFSRLAVVGALLKSRGAISRDIAEERHIGDYVCSFFLSSFLFAAAYGAVLGMFQPGLQTLYAAVKLPIIVLGTALICTPTFYVFNSILGSTLSFRQSVALIFLLTAAATTILAAFAPIAWFFTVSTGGLGFLTVLHIAVFVVALAYGERLLRSTRTLLSAARNQAPAVNGGFLTVWVLVVLFVGLQMAYSFRPLISEGPFTTGERGLCFEALDPGSAER
ncbi:MAG: hypothetical protein HYY18_12460 [Planctomycetes bacterium]|nr:hypothetical protein [Planctomycetota bacterium]